MKRLSSIFMVAVVIAMTAISCGKDNSDPVISGFVTEGMVMPDSVVAIAATLTDAEGLASYKLDVVSASSGSSVSGYPKTMDVDGGSATIAETFTIPSQAAAGDNFKITLAVTDDDKEAVTTTEELTVTVVASENQAGTVTEYTVVILGNQNNTTGSFYATSSNLVYTQTQAEANSADVDFLHYFGNANAATISAPDDVTVNGGTGNFDFCEDFAVKNATRFKVTTLDYSLVIDDSQLVVETDITSSKLTQMVIGSKFVFETVAGKRGIAQVTDLTGNNTNSGSMTLKVKIQD